MSAGAGRGRCAVSRTCRARLRAIARPGDVVITLGAGSIGTVPDRLIELTGRNGVDRPRTDGGREPGRRARGQTFPPCARQAGAARWRAIARRPSSSTACRRCCVVFALYRGELSRGARAGACDRSHRRCAATSAVEWRSTGRCRRPARREHRLDRSRRPGGAAARVAVGAGSRRSDGRCRRRSKSIVSERKPIGHWPHRRQALPRRRTRRDHRRIRTAIRGLRPADRRRPDAGHRGTDTPTNETRARAGVARSSRRLASEAGDRRGACRRSTSAMRTTPPSSLSGRSRAESTSANEQFLDAASSRTCELAPTLQRQRSPTSTTVDCGSTTRIFVRPVGKTKSTTGAGIAGAVSDADDQRVRKRRTTGGSVARKERYLVGLDVGTSKVTAVVGEMLEAARARHRRARRRRVARHPARRRGEPRGGGRIDQERRSKKPS